MIRYYFPYNPIFCFLLLLVILFSTGCSLTKNLSEEDYLYMGTELSINDKENSNSVEEFNYSINEITVAPTQPGIGNIYIGLYNIFDQTEEKGFKHWVKNKLGKSPVFFDPTMINQTEDKLVYYLNGKGFFTNKVSCDSIKKDIEVNIECAVELGERYKIDSIIFPIEPTYAALKLDQRLQRAIIKEGIYYDRDRLDFERFRLSNIAGNIGFADFVTDNVYFYVDTLSQGEHVVDVYLKILSPTDSTAHKRYILDSINIFPNHSLDNLSETKLKKSEVKKDINIYESEHYLDHQLIDRLILEKTGGYYNRSLEKRTLNRILDLGLFKFINIENIPTKNGKKDHFVQNIYLTPTKMQSVSGEVELNNRSGNFFGTGASAKYQHLNLFKQAAQFNLSLGGQVETQFGNGFSLINSSDINASMELAFPRFIVPFIKIKEGVNYIPRTVIKTNFTYQRRTQFYTLQGITGRFGYKWREKKTTFHELYPLVINQVNVTNKSDEFQKLLDNDPRLLSSFQNVLIGGLQYYYIYSDQANRADKSYNFFRAELETSGNLLSIFSKGSAAQPSQIAGFNYAQFTKITLDYRKYFKLKNSDIATRLLVGTGLAYGNSSELPYTKQYLIGGSNSLRAFSLRGLGPGSFFTDQTDLNSFSSQFIDQTGDMKLEMNAEYRFPIFSYLKGALFVDAGNVWLINNEDRPNGNFKFNNFYKEIAVGTGLGLRIDFDFFLIRFDLAFPLRAPTPSSNFQWLVSEINPISSTWRKQNLKLNLGIGYPF